MTTHNPETFRVFTAFDLPRAMNEELFRVAKRIAAKEKGIKCTLPGNIHVTLHFFAALEKERLETLLATCEKVLHNVHSFHANIAGIGAFPNNRAPQIIWAGVDEGQQQISLIKHELDHELEVQGYGIEKRKYVPHLTIARVKFCYDQKALQRRIETENAFSLNRAEISAMHVIKSSLTPNGPVYEVIRSFSLDV